MTDDPVLDAMQEFIKTVTGRIAKQDLKIAEQAEEVRSLRSELLTRSAPQVIEGPAGKDGEAGAPGKDGIGIESVAVLDDGQLGVTFTNGEKRAVGRVVGRDGVDGKDGRDGPPGPEGSPSTVPGPAGKDGERGADGIATREELDSLIESRFAEIQVRTLADYYRGTFVKGEMYTRSSIAVWNGASWLAMEETNEVPGTSPTWRLLAKQGRDGRDAKR